MSITKSIALTLGSGQEIHSNTLKNADGTCQRWRVNGQCKIWVRQQHSFCIPIKRGLNQYSYLTDETECYYHLAIECTNDK